MNKDLLKEYLSTKYQGPASFLETVIFPIFGEGNFEDGYETELLDIQPERRRMAEATGICSVKQIGTIYVDVEPLYIFDITVSDRVMMERNRVSIQRLIRAVMDHYSCAFMLFHYEDDIRWDWRFTYCHKSANANESTDSKRYTFLLGPGQSCRTAVDNFLKLYNDRKELKIANIEKAFDVEALSKEFFGKYKEHYAIFVNYMIDPKNGMRQQFIDQNFDHTGLDEQAIKEREEKPIRDYVKRLLGRIVFLHFLQKKGWLGVKANGDWGSGDYDFMYQLFENATDEQKDNFLDDVLEPIFNALNNDRSKDNDCVDTKVNGFGVCRIPYLNGGLFERDKYDEIPTVFPYYFFENLLTFFHQYNFTIDENDPNEAEVGIDPEMLGCIFENLLEDNKDKGAFYTPKEIVQYMCRESLIAYLQTDCDEDKKEAIRQFVTTYDVDCIEDIKDIIDKKLCEVKICDPAIGSGAFPMGLLRELFFCRSAIEPNIVENAADIKKHIIQNSIYGVDIEKGAIDIARLRFWLSIVVDSDKPEQLPNFDYKFMQGNSLIESFMGVDLSEIMCSDVVGKSKKNSGVGTLSFDESASVNDIRELLKGYFCEKNFEKKKNTKKQINEKVKEFIGHKTSGNPTIPQQLDLIDVSSNDQFFLWHTWFADVFNRTSKQGFDIVIGNPPYGAKYDEKSKKYYKINYVTAKSIKGIQKASLDTYTLFIELGYNLLKKNGCFAYIVPISLTSSDSLSGVHRILKEKCDNIHISSYAVRPQPIFENAVVNTSILLFQKTDFPCQKLYSTKMHRKGNNFNLQNLIDNLQFIDVKELMLFGRIPKIGLQIEKNILKKVFSHNKLSSFIQNSGNPIIYRFAGGRYFKVVTNYSNGSSAERTIYFENQQMANAIGCILSSNLSFWFYQIFSDNLNWKTYEIENFTIPYLSEENIKFLNEKYSEYLIDIEANANIRTTSGASSYNVNSFKEYKIVHSKPIIDEIDDYIGPLYGLSQEETNFIKNYELEFRLAGE